MNAKYLAILVLLSITVISIYPKTKGEEKIKIKEITEKIEEKILPKEVKTYEEAIELSKKSGCNIFIYFGAPWCGYCNKMLQTTLSDAEVVEKLSKNYVVLKIDIDFNKKLTKMYEVEGIPHYFIINNKEKIIKENLGFKNKKEFLEWLKD